MEFTIKFDRRLVLLSSIYLFLAISVVLIAFPATAIWLPRDSSEMASWVQAFGSISAIVGAFGIAMYQHKLSLIKEASDRKNRSYAYSSVFEKILEYFTNLEKNLSSWQEASWFFHEWEDPKDRFNPDEFQFLISLLNGIDISIFDDNEKIDALIMLKLSVMEINKSLLHLAGFDAYALDNYYSDGRHQQYDDYESENYKNIKKYCSILLAK